MRLRLLALAVAAATAAGCTGGGGAPSIPPRPSLASRPAAAASCLLDDAALRTAADPKAPDVGKTYERWTAARAVPVRSETCDTDFSDLAPFGAVVGSKRIVGLGESSHGVGDYSALKVRLIKYLHEKLGFNVIAFEYDMFDDYLVNGKLASLEPEEAMYRGIFGVWWSTEALPLFTYLREQAKSGHPLALAGFDVQEFAMIPQRVQAFSSAIAPVSSKYAAAVAAADGKYLQLVSKTSYKPTKKNVAALEAAMPKIQRFYADLTAWMDAHMPDLIAHAKDPNVPGLMRQVAAGTPNYALEIEAVSQNDYAGATRARDAGMAADVRYLANTLYPGEKIVLWAHNYHIARGQEHLANMGSLIRADFGDGYYATGLLPYRGQGDYNNRQTYTQAPAPADSIDAILYYSRWKWAFVDQTSVAHVAGTAWMHARPLRFDDFGFYKGDYPAIPDELFDGFMFVDTIHPPHYLPTTAAREELRL